MSAKEYRIAYPGQSRANPPRAERAEEPRPSWHRGTAPKAAVFDQEQPTQPMPSPSWWQATQAAAQPLQQKLSAESQSMSPKKLMAIIAATVLGLLILVATVSGMSTDQRSYHAGYEWGIAGIPCSTAVVELRLSSDVDTYDEGDFKDGCRAGHQDYLR